VPSKNGTTERALVVLPESLVQDLDMTILYLPILLGSGHAVGFGERSIVLVVLLNLFIYVRGINPGFSTFGVYCP